MTLSTPATTVTAFFEFPFTAEAFTLNDPVRGALDNATFRLYASTPVVLESSTQQVTIRRGTSAQILPEAEAGTSVVTLLNLDRTFDPSHASSPYFGNITPGRRFTIATAGVSIFDARVEDWDLDYDVSGMSTAVAKLSDGLATLARQEFDDWTATALQAAGARLSAVLDRAEVQWPSARALDTGVSSLQGDVVAWGTNVLEYCKLVAKSDLGVLFVDRTGVLTFKDRHAVLNSPPSVTFAADGTGIAWRRIEASYGSEVLFNRVGVTRVGGATQTVIDLDAQLSYGVRSYTAPTLLLDSNAQALDMANFILTQYTDPQTRISLVEVELSVLSSDEQSQVLQLDIMSVVRVVFTPNAIGVAIDRLCVIYGMDHAITPQSHVVTLHLGDADNRSVMVLDDATFGKLDSNVLAF